MKQHFEYNPTHARFVVGLMYASLIAMSTLRGYFHLVELPWYATQFAYIAVLGIGLLWIFVTAKISRLNISLNVMLVQMIPHLIILIYSIALWVTREEPLSLIMRGSSLTAYQLLLLSMLISVGAMFGGQAIEYTTIGFILANTLILLDVFRRMGVGPTITGMLSFWLSAGSNDNNISVLLEVQDVTFGIGILFAYYLVDGKEEHWRWFYVAALGFYLMTGFKRILFPAIAVGAAYYYLCSRCNKKQQIHLSIAIGFALIFISFTYVVLIRSGLWFDICDKLGIDLMGRKRLYHHMQAYYSISPSYLGLGSGMVSKVLEVVEVTGNRRLHSDVLRMYIELGMGAFLLWCYTMFIFTYAHFANKYSLRCAKIYMLVTLLMFVTFLTDNTLEKYCPQIAWHVLPIGIIFADSEKITMHMIQTAQDNSCSAALEKFRKEKWG